jgi:Zn-dependent M28 family amino/carboxypeptidase
MKNRQISVDDEQDLPERLSTHVDRLAGLIGPRHLGKPSTMEVTATYIERQLVDLGYSVDRHVYDVDGSQPANLVAERPGTQRTDEVVILGAHYDTVPETPGADDNASAVAMLIEVARILQSSVLKRTLRFVAFPCEEFPHCHTDTMGSRVYARQCRIRGERIVGMLCLEMVGYYSTEPNSQQIPPGIPRSLRWAFPKRGDFLAAVGNLRSWRIGWTFRRGFKLASRFPLYSIVLPERISEIRRSDNSSFWDQGYPALMLTDTSFLRNPHYHAETDTPDTLDYPRMAQATLGVAGGAKRLAKIDGRH